MNRKKIQRLWREEGLRVPAKRRKRQRLGHSTTPGRPARGRAARSRVGARLPVRRHRHREDPQAPARRRRVHPRVPRRSRRPLHRRRRHRRRPRQDRRCSAAGTPSSSAATTAPSSPPTPCATGAASPAPATSYIEPGSPWQNPWVESYGCRIRDELLAIEAVRHPARSPSPRRRLADRVQHLPTPLRPRHAHPDRVRRPWRHTNQPQLS